MTLVVRNPVCTLSRKKKENNKNKDKERKKKGKIKFGKTDQQCFQLMMKNGFSMWGAIVQLKIPNFRILSSLRRNLGGCTHFTLRRVVLPRCHCEPLETVPLSLGVISSLEHVL